MPMQKPMHRSPLPGWRPSRRILTGLKEDAVRFLEFVQPALQTLVGGNLLLIVPETERLAYWILTETGNVNLQALRRQLPPGDMHVETPGVFREAARRGDRAHVRVLRNHLYAVGNRRLLARLPEGKA